MPYYCIILYNYKITAQIAGHCILHNGEDLHVKITVFCEVAPHNMLYGEISCFSLQRFHKIIKICIPKLILLRDKIEKGEFDEVIGIRCKAYKYKTVVRLYEETSLLGTPM